MSRTIDKHPADNNGKLREILLTVDGSAVTATSGSAGLLAGADVANIKMVTNTVTVTFKEALPNAEYNVQCTTLSADAKVDVVTKAKGSLIFTTVENDDTTAAKEDVDLDIVIKYYDNPTVR